MRKYLTIAVLLLAAGVAIAGGWGYAWPNNSSTKTYDSLMLKEGKNDTSVVFYFPPDMSSAYANVILRTLCLKASTTAAKYPLISWKPVFAGKRYASDSTVAGAWIKLVDSTHITISAGDTVYQWKVIGNYPGLQGIQFKGEQPLDSTKVIIRVTGAK